MQKKNKNFFGKKVVVFLFLGLITSLIQAAVPLWTFDPLTPISMVVPVNRTVIVQYRITNQSLRSHTLIMQPIPGVMQITSGLGVCGNPFVLMSKGSCILSLQINGGQLSHPIKDGPIVCQGGNPNQCYQPRATDILHITQSPSILSTLYGVTGDGSPSLPETLFTLSPNTAQATFVMPLGNGGDGESIASDGTHLYHWSGYPGNAVIYERIDLLTQTTTIIPQSGDPVSDEITGAVFYNQANGFLVTDRSYSFMNFSRFGVVSLLGNTLVTDYLRGMACFAHQVYAIQRNPVVINQLNPSNGAILSTSPAVTLPGFVVNQGIGLTVDPGTGIFYALLGVQGSNIRKLATIDITTGVATEIGDANDGSNLRFASIAFHPADPNC